MKTIACFIPALAALLLMVGCSTNPLPDKVLGPGGDSNQNPNPGPCPTCPDTTTPPPPPGTIITTYDTKGFTIHEAQSHELVTTVTVPNTSAVIQLNVPVFYKTGNAVNNQSWHAYLRSTNNFAQKFDLINPKTGTQVVADPLATDGWVNESVRISGVPPGMYTLIVQQDVPNPNTPGESPTTFGDGTVTISQP